MKSLLSIACVLAFAVSALGAEPPKKAAVKRLYGVHSPSGWLMFIHDDGSAALMFGAGGGLLDSLNAPEGTFKPDEVRKVLDGLTYDTKGSGKSHFAIWYEEERKSPENGPKARHTNDEKAIVPLFETADAARKKKYNEIWKKNELFRERPGFGLPKD